MTCARPTASAVTAQVAIQTEMSGPAALGMAGARHVPQHPLLQADATQHPNNMQSNTESIGLGFCADTQHAEAVNTPGKASTILGKSHQH